MPPLPGTGHVASTAPSKRASATGVPRRGRAGPSSSPLANAVAPGGLRATKTSTMRRPLATGRSCDQTTSASPDGRIAGLAGPTLQSADRRHELLARAQAAGGGPRRTHWPLRREPHSGGGGRRVAATNVATAKPPGPTAIGGPFAARTSGRSARAGRARRQLRAEQPDRRLLLAHDASTTPSGPAASRRPRPPTRRTETSARGPAAGGQARRLQRVRLVEAGGRRPGDDGAAVGRRRDRRRDAIGADAVRAAEAPVLAEERELQHAADGERAARHTSATRPSPSTAIRGSAASARRPAARTCGCPKRRPRRAVVRDYRRSRPRRRGRTRVQRRSSRLRR